MTHSDSRRLPGARTAVAAALLAVALAFPAYARSASGVTVGFEMSPRGHILVPVSINGSPPLVVALDTAAGRTTVTSAVARQLTLPESPGETAKVAGVHGLTENPVVQLRSVSIGDAEARDFKAVVMDLDHITRGVWRADGILGMDYLQNFDLRLDFGVRTVSLFPRAASPKSCPACPKGRQGIAFESIHTGFIVLPVTVDGRPVRAVLDTGSGHSGLNGKAAKSLGVTLPPMPEGAPSGHGFGLQTGPLRLGDTVLNEHPTLYVVDHPLMQNLGLADGPSMLMGTDQLAGRALTISYGLGKVFVE